MTLLRLADAHPRMVPPAPDRLRDLPRDAASVPPSGDSAKSPVSPTKSGLEDERLVALIRAGDDAAFETVFRLYAAALCTFAAQLLHAHESAADLVHDVFLNVWRNREHLHIRESLQAYLYRAVRNRALDTKARERVSERWVATLADEKGAVVEPFVRPSIDREIDARSLTTALEQALHLLPAKRRQVFLLRWKEELSYAEIAEMLDISPRTVEVQMRRALQALRAHLAPLLT